MAKRLIPKIISAAQVGEIIGPEDTPAPRLSRLPSPSKLFAREDFTKAIRSAWLDAQGMFVEVGRYLIEAKSRLEHGQFMAMVEQDLPFKHPTANKLMSVARLIDSGAVDPSLLPPTSETCYLITTLTQDEREAAIAEGIIRPAVQRQEILTFKRRMRTPQSLPATLPSPRDRRAELEAERDRLKAMLDAVEQELRELTS